MKLITKKIFSLITVFGLVVPFVMNSQSMTTPPSPQALTLKASTSMPQPGDVVTIEANSLSIDLNRSSISWIINGTPFGTGVGLKKISTSVGKSGDPFVVSATVISNEGERVSRSLSMKVAGVDLIWEAYSYTPPFYKGKGLPSHETLIKILAVPDPAGFKNANSKSLVYKWSQDGVVLGSLSGLAKDSLIIRMPKLVETTRINVEVSGLDETERASNSILLRTGNPTVMVYEEHPLFGVRFEKTLSGDVVLEGDEITMVGYPYFFSEAETASSKLQYSWRINQMGTGVTNNEIVLRAPEDTVGVSQVTFKVDNIKEIMQSAATVVNLVFGRNESGSNPFF